MKPVSVLIEELWETLPDTAEKAMQWMRLVLPRLPALIAFVLVAFSAGWIGGRWAAWPSAQKETSPAPRDAAAAATVSQAMKLPAPYEEAAPVPPQDTPASQEEGNAAGRAYLGIRGKEFHRGEVRGVKVSEVFPDSPAAKAGLRSDRDPTPAYLRQSGGGTGHIIVGANGRAIRSEEDMGRLLALNSPGSVIKFLVTSADGSAYEVIPVTLGAATERSPVVQTSAERRVQSSADQGETPKEELEQEIFQAVNRARAEKGLPPLQRAPQLQEVARRHSEDMASRRFFGHLNPDGQDVVDRLRAEGIADFTAAGENLFSGKQVADPMQLAVVREWLKNPSHSKNLLSPRYTEGGVGIARAEKEQIYVTEVYLER